MSSFKFKRGQESKVSSLAREDGSLIFSLNGANDSTLRMDAAISGTVQRVGIAVDRAKNADKFSEYQYYGDLYKYKNSFKQPTANVEWYLRIATPDWNNTSENIIIRGAGNNRNGTTILKTGSRQANWWGYATQYNGTCLIGVKKVIGNADLVYLKFDSGTTAVDIYTSFSPRITQESTTDYTSVPSEGGFFANQIKATLIGTAENSNALGGSSLSNILDRINNTTGSGSAFTGLDTTTNNVVKLTRANGGTVQKTINNVSNASSASYAGISAYPQGFASKTSSATWGNTTGTFITGWHTSSGGDVAFMNDNPASGQVSMKLDGYFYQNEGAKRVLDTDDGATFVKKAGDTMTGQLNLAVGQNKGLKLGAAKIVAASASNGEFVLQGGHLRLGADAYDYNQWAGLKYDHSKKAVYLGIADGTIFQANQAQSNGSIFTPGISNIYLGASTATKLLTSTDGAGYVKKSGDTMTGGISYQGSKATYSMIRFLDNAADTYGNGISIGGGGAAIIGGGESATAVQSLLTNGGDEKLILANDGAIDIYTNVQNGLSSATHVTIDTSGVYTGLASSAKVISPFENATANAARNVWFSDSATRNKPCYNDNFKYNPVSNLLTTNISGSAAKWATARTISLNGDLVGSFSLDGSQDVSTSVYTYNCKATIGNKNNYPYHRIAKLDTITGSYTDKSTLLYISQDYDGGYFGLIRITLRTNNVSGNAASNVSANWLIRRGFSVDAIQIGHYKIAGKTYADVFYKSNGAYATLTVRDFGSGSRSGAGRAWTLVSSTEANDTTTSDKKTSSECWESIATAGSALHNQAYNETVTGSDVGTVSYANNSGALGGSSLSQILASAGNGQAFTGLDTTTNNVVKLTRANGGTIQKTINNVSNASSASYAANANKATTASTASIASTANYVARAEQAKYLYRNPSARATSANLSVTGNGGLQTFKATSSMTTGKPPWDSHVIHMDWDTTGGWNAQIAVAAQTSPHMAIRGMNGTTWDTKWNIVLDSANYSSYAADRTAISGASVKDRTITFTRANGSTFSINTYDSNTTYPVYGRTLSSTFANGFRSETYGSTNQGWYISAIRNNTASVTGAPQYGSGMAWGHSDTHGYLYVSYSSAEAYLGGGNSNKLNWQKRIAFTDSKVASASSADIASNANKLGSLPSTDYALKKDLSGDINALNAKYLSTYASASIKDAFFYRYGLPSNVATWAGFPSTYLSSTASTANSFGNGMYQKNVGVLHLAAGSSYHDLVFQAGGTNDGIVYAGSGRNIAYLLDTQNYKSRGNNFNSLTAVSLSVSSTNVVIDGGSY